MKLINIDSWRNNPNNLKHQSLRGKVNEYDGEVVYSLSLCNLIIEELPCKIYFCIISQSTLM